MVTIIKNKVKSIIIVMIMIIGFSNATYGIISVLGTATWSDPDYIADDVEILNGGTLIITCDISFHSSNSIKVHPGGKLIVTGGRLTNAIPNELWKGIIVVGNKGLIQTYANQGTVILNNAVIENAECVILVGLRYTQQVSNGINVYFLNGGGIVEAENSHFINNLEAVRFNDYLYRNSYNYNECNNVSSFINCEFMNNGQAFFPTFDAMVYLTGVRGVAFKGCVFTNQLTDPHCCGIYANDAGFSLNLANPYGFNILYPPYGNYYQGVCSFSGFAYAINVTSTRTKETIILNTHFSENKYNVVANKSSNIRIESCVLNGSSSNEISVMLALSTAYKIANNLFDGGKIGLYIPGEDFSNIIVPNNTFQNISCQAIWVSGIHSSDFPVMSGLQFYCNKFESNEYDIYVGPNSSIRREQGVFEKKTAGNNFGQGASSWNIYNDQNNPAIMYCYDNYVPLERPLNVSSVSLDPNAKYNECRGVGYMGDLYYPGLNVGSLNDIEDIYDIMGVNFQVLCSEYEATYENEIDWISYYEGDTSFQQQVDDYIIISLMKDSMDFLCINAIQILLSETELNKSSYNLWISRLQSPVMDFVLAESYLDENNISLMNSTLDMMLTKYPNYPVVDVLNTKICLNYLAEWDFDDNDSAFITQTAIDSLTIIASGSGNSSFLATAILDKIFGNITYDAFSCQCPPLPEYQIPLSVKNNIENNIVIVPNPTNDLISINAENKEYIIQNISLYDMYGKKVLFMEVDSYCIDVHLSDISKGVYFLSCQMQDGKSVTKKIIKK